jgi:minor histocompatibility antigen H13
VLGVFGVGRLAGDVLNVAATFLFPSVWSSGKETYYVEPLLSVQVSGPVKKARALTTRKNVEDKTNPLPGFLSTIKFSDSVTKKLWAYRALLKNHWIFRGYLHGKSMFRNPAQPVPGADHDQESSTISKMSISMMLLDSSLE